MVGGGCPQWAPHLGAICAVLFCRAPDLVHGLRARARRVPARPGGPVMGCLSMASHHCAARWCVQAVRSGWGRGRWLPGVARGAGDV